MNYTNVTCADPNVGACDCKISTAPMRLGDTLQNTCALSADALVLARRIGRFLFNIEETSCEKMPDPQCFQDELMLTRHNLNSVCELLSDLSNMLGLN